MTGPAVTIEVTTRYYDDGTRCRLSRSPVVALYREEGGTRWASVTPEGDGTATVVVYDSPHYCSGPERLRAAWAHKRAQKWVGW